MKKALSVILIVLMVFSFAAAEEFDLSKLTFQELDNLRAKCQKEMMNRDEWQQVTVPPGVYQVGVHIPAGTWRVICRSRISTLISWGNKLEENGHEVDYHDTKRYDIERVYNSESKYFDKGSVTEYTITVYENEWIIIDDSDAIFTPPVTPQLGFK